MRSSAVEDYLKAIYALQEEAPMGEASVARIAALLGVTKGSVTSMVRKLREAGLVDAKRYGCVTLTDKGRRGALDVVRRHRLIEVFLVDVLKFDWSEVHEEAERLEHAMSAKFLERLDAYLGHPSIDPHGDPIPDKNGHMAGGAGVALTAVPAGEERVIARIVDQEPTFLDFAAAHGLRPGTRIGVLEIVPEAQSITMQADEHASVTLSFQSAEKIIVLPQPA